MQILLKIKDVPEGMTVYKKGGTSPFIVRKNLKIYTYGTTDKTTTGNLKVIDAPDNKYMVDANGNINMVSDDTVVRVDITDVDGSFNIYTLEKILSNITGRFVQISVETPQ